jgi:hypothetical protein
MGNSYKEIQDAIKVTLDADSWFDETSSSIQTVEVNERETELRHKESYAGFLYSELPALTISATGKESDLNTTQEIREEFLVECRLVTRARDEQSGMDTHLGKIKEVERVLRKQITSSDDLGINAFVFDVNTEKEETEKDGTYWIFKTLTFCTVEIIETY